jgi:hypothetical protein
MTKRRKVALGISAALLVLGIGLRHFSIPAGYAITGPAMIFHVIYAVLLPGTTGESWWKPEFVVSGLAYLTICYFYAIMIGFVLRLFGAYKTPAELEQLAAKERGEMAINKGGTTYGKLVKYAAIAVFATVVVWLQGKQEDDFMEKSKLAAASHCNQESTCLRNVDQNFNACFEANHESHKSGRFSRKHSLDESGFNSCLTSYLPPMEPAHAIDEVSAAADTSVALTAPPSS